VADYTGTTEVDEPTFVYYQDTWGGKLSEAVFADLKKKAAAKVDRAIWPNQVSDATMDAYRRAVCAVVDLLHDPEVVRESAGKTTVEYADVQTVDKTIREYLTGTGLLYAGL
jgi:histone H3/H4